MTAKSIKSVHVPQSGYKGFQHKASEFHQVMKLSLDSELWNGVGLNAVHCVISLSDALTVYFLHKRFSGDDHRHASELLAQIPNSGVKQYVNAFDKIISKKHMVAYEEREFRQSEAWEIAKQTKRFFEWGMDQLPH